MKHLHGEAASGQDESLRNVIGKTSLTSPSFPFLGILVARSALTINPFFEYIFVCMALDLVLDYAFGIRE